MHCHAGEIHEHLMTAVWADLANVSLRYIAVDVADSFFAIRASWFTLEFHSTQVLSCIYTSLHPAYQWISLLVPSENRQNSSFFSRSCFGRQRNRARYLPMVLIARGKQHYWYIRLGIMTVSHLSCAIFRSPIKDAA